MRQQTLKPGDHILQVIAKNKITQREFATNVEMSYSMLNEIISGKKYLNVFKAVEIEKKYPDFDSMEAMRVQFEIIRKERIS